MSCSLLWGSDFVGSIVTEPVRRLLSQMADGAWHSGEALGQALGVSRAAVWKAFKRLESLGVNYESVTGKGYRLVSALDLLDEKVLSEGLLKSRLALRYQSTIDSTNAELLRAYANGESVHGQLCVTELQTAGRGRRGRVWHSPYAANLYFSLGWEFSGGVTAMEGLSLAVGLSICEVLESQGLADAQLKWPNDVLVAGRKLAGVLIELAGDASGDCVAVIGVGLNVAMPREGAEVIDRPWVDLRELGLRLSRTQLLLAICERLEPLLMTYEQCRFAAYRDRWQQRDAFAGQLVRLGTEARFNEGFVEGVNDSGALLLRSGNELLECVGGELSLRPVSDFN
jgi:BirA family biotin operon repressor/biotin-[acetyl-CoA-carboxylase] ligase